MPFLFILPTRSGLNLSNATWQQYREVVMVNIAPETLSFFSKGDVMDWFEKGGGQLGVSGYRAFISRAANIFMKIFFPISGLKEYSCGFRGYRAKKIHEVIAVYGNNFIQLKGLGFTCTLEKLVKLKLIGAKFGEIPFVLRYDQKVGESKMVGSITTLGYLVMTLLYHWPWGGWRSRMKLSQKGKGHA